MNNYDTDLYENFRISEEEVSSFQRNHVGFCNVDMSRVSQFLKIQLASYSKHNYYNPFSITDVIQKLEGCGRGSHPIEKQFKHLPLQGFWKTHFHDPRFIPQNIINHWGLKFENSKKIDELCARIATAEEELPSKLGLQGRLAHELTIGAYQEKTRQKGLAGLTGEWIVFAKYSGFNYYLCIANHTSNPDEDTPLYNFIKTLCEHEYPFLMNK